MGCSRKQQNFLPYVGLKQQSSSSPSIGSYSPAANQTSIRDSDYSRWEWQLDDCTLPRFNPELALKKLRGKRLLFVGDSLQRGQWQSFICLVEWIIPEDKKSLKQGQPHSVFRAKLSEYRIDSHSSVYTKTGGKLLTKEQRADPFQHADCIHWCLPGVPDTWNQIFLAYL
ncbi:hypothetical protein SADUNF_Sadunf16G0100900 [Salix dunnii]|uniref:Trichome birefringence-like C-terminal domain-containing protein n=1 Tax=Salix dunnii TaxID=1413687 RepID=A0A835JAV3_9ROSI|nr:hypothetical protein SADUNF_Sadunf16G0100900 [Salix dunnii]